MESRRGHQSLLEQELQLVLSRLMWALGTELGPSAKEIDIKLADTIYDIYL